MHAPACRQSSHHLYNLIVIKTLHSHLVAQLLTPAAHHTILQIVFFHSEQAFPKLPTGQKQPPGDSAKLTAISSHAPSLQRHSASSSTTRNVVTLYRYIFPGLAMGAHLASAQTVSDNMLTAASEALPQLIPEADRVRGCVYPSLKDIR